MLLSPLRKRILHYFELFRLSPAPLRFRSNRQNQPVYSPRTRPLLTLSCVLKRLRGPGDSPSLNKAVPSRQVLYAIAVAKPAAHPTQLPHCGQDVMNVRPIFALILPAGLKIAPYIQITSIDRRYAYGVCK